MGRSFIPLLNETAGSDETWTEDPMMFAKMQCVLRAARHEDGEAIKLIAAEEYGWTRWAWFIQAKAEAAEVEWVTRDCASRKSRTI